MCEDDAHTVCLGQEILYSNGGNKAWLGNLLTQITSLFMVRNIKCGYSFS